MEKMVSGQLFDVGSATIAVAKHREGKFTKGLEDATVQRKQTIGNRTSSDEYVSDEYASDEYASDENAIDEYRGVVGIEEEMEVIASCGKKIGVVHEVHGNSLKLSRKGSPDNQHHYIPLSWISELDDQIHLNKNSKEAVEGWKSNAALCGCGASE